MSLRTRLQRLERKVVDPGCPACRDRRGRIVFVMAQRLPDGTVVPQEEEPQPCARCGQVPEQIIEVIETVVDEPTNAADSEMPT
ncbi:MAG TPA: hypothetical protein VH575_34870 [Gemmataceae bacterium]|jgi:hypothetical protein